MFIKMETKQKTIIAQITGVRFNKEENNGFLYILEEGLSIAKPIPIKTRKQYNTLIKKMNLGIQIIEINWL